MKDVKDIINHQQDSPNLVLQANRLSQLEVLVGYITHDMNNAMSFIVLETESLEMRLLKRKIEILTTLINTLQHLFATNNEVNYVCDVNHCIEKTLEFCSAILKNNFFVECHYNPDKLRVNLSAQLFQQLIINLILHAHKNMLEIEERKSLKISTELVNSNCKITFKELDFFPSEIEIPSYGSTNQRELTIEAIYNIIDSCQGTIEITSDPSGLEFIIFIPLAI